MDFVSLITGVITGVLSSFLLWVFLFHYLSPRIEFSQAICKSASKSRGCGFLFRIKLHNARRRTAINANLKCSIVFPDLVGEGTNNVYYIPVGNPLIVEIYPYFKSGRNRKIIFLNLDDDNFTKIFEKPFFPEKIKQLAQEKKMSLEDMLSIKEGSFLRLSVYCSDSFSGAVKIFRSKNYYLKDIILGDFDKGSLRIIPNVNDI